MNVYFDDLKITHRKSRIVQKDDYYPFGLSFNSYQRPNTAEQNYLYNGKEMQDELDLDWMDYGARMYDPSIGRFMTIDPMADKFHGWSPYSFVFDNPVNFVDPDGMEPDPINDINKILEKLGKTQGYVITTNNETGVVTIFRTEAALSKDKSSDTENINITITESVYTIGADGELSDAYITTTNVSASFEESTSAFGEPERTVTGVESEQASHDFATSTHDKEKLQKMGESDYVVQGVSALAKSYNRDMLFTQSGDLPYLSFYDKTENAIPYVIQMAAALVKVKGTKSTETGGLERLLRKDQNGSTTMRFQLNKDWDVNVKLQRLANKQRFIEN